MLAVVASSRFVLRPVVGVLTKASPRRNCYTRVVSGPPRVRISFPEKVAHGLFIFIACSTIPFIISSNIPKYTDRSEDDD